MTKKNKQYHTKLDYLVYFFNILMNMDEFLGEACNAKFILNYYLIVIRAMNIFFHPVYPFPFSPKKWRNWPTNEFYVSKLNWRKGSPVIISTYILHPFIYRTNCRLCLSFRLHIFCAAILQAFRDLKSAGKFLASRGFSSYLGMVNWVTPKIMKLRNRKW